MMISKEFISHHITESIKSKLKRQVILGGWDRTYFFCLNATVVTSKASKWLFGGLQNPSPQLVSVMKRYSDVHSSHMLM